VTLLGPSAAHSDAMTTALCLMPPQEAVQFIHDKLPDDKIVISLYHAQHDTLEVITTLEESRITIDDPAYVRASEQPNGRLIYTGTFFP